MDKKYIVIGGGTFGLSTALALSEKISAKDIFVLDRSQIPASDASSTDINKIVRAEYGDDEEYTKLALMSLQVFRQWNTTNPLFNESGILFASKSNKQSFESKSLQTLIKLGNDSSISILNFKQNSSLEHLQKRMKCGLFNSKDGWADSELTLKFMYQLLLNRGVTFYTGTSGTVVRIVRDGVIETLDGIFHQGTIIIACGAWTTTILPEMNGIIKTTGQPVVHFQIPKANQDSYSPNCVWLADIANTGYYGFPQTKSGEIKIANHGPGYSNSKGIPQHLSEIPLESVMKFRQFFSEYFPQYNHLDISRTRMCW
jgi:sarcosine oxidase/L-pipecolate oxidase